MENNEPKKYSRRAFLKALGVGAAAIGVAQLESCTGNKSTASSTDSTTAANVPDSGMTYRTSTSHGEKVSLLGYGCMRWPTKSVVNENGEPEDVLDQDEINRLVDYAIEHGVNYFDTAPVYCKGKSEEATGIALSRHPRDKYLIATKLSNFSADAFSPEAKAAGAEKPDVWTLEAGVKMFENSLKLLHTDHIDYLLLHSVGGTGMDGLRKRFFDNGLLDYLLAQREAGRIRNLGFSYHGDVEVFDYLVANNDKYHWDFVQIQLNYLDWTHAKQVNERNTDAEYLYNELAKRNIQSVIMEPLLGGRLANVPDFVATELKAREPEKSIASWAFRFAGHYPLVLTVLSGMTYMEHLQDNLRSYMPHKPLSDDELAFLERIAGLIAGHPTVPCTACEYCMPCPYGINIPAILKHYNKCVNEGNIIDSPDTDGYKAARRAFLVGYDRSVPKLRQAAHCIGCGECLNKCPQHIQIPQWLARIDTYVESLKRN